MSSTSPGKWSAGSCSGTKVCYGLKPSSRSTPIPGRSRSLLDDRDLTSSLDPDPVSSKGEFEGSIDSTLSKASIEDARIDRMVQPLVQIERIRAAIFRDGSEDTVTGATRTGRVEYRLLTNGHQQSGPQASDKTPSGR